MVDHRFYSRKGPFTLGELAKLINADLNSDDYSCRLLSDVGPLNTANQDQLSFLDNPKYISEFQKTNAGACIVSPRLASKATPDAALLLSKNPYKAYALAARVFYPVINPEPAISQSASIGNNANIDKSSRIEPGVVVGEGAVSGKCCLISANVVIGPSVEIGDYVVIGANASLSHCFIGNHTHIYPGVQIGQDGFGFHPDIEGHTKVPQLGRVIIGENVEIGANSTIDRGSGPDTIIGNGCWIDNLVQIAHNVELGRGCVIAAQSGISGSSKVGDFVFVAGQVGIVCHLSIGSGARIDGQSGVIKDVPPGATMGGTPAVSIKDWHRQSIVLSNLINKDKRINE